MIRVLHLIPALDVGGAERLLVSLARHHDRTAVSLRVAYFRDGDALRDAIAAEGIRVDRIAPSDLPQRLADWKIDVLHSHLIRADLLAGANSRRPDAPRWISTRHNTRYFRGLRRPYGWIDRSYTRNAAALVAVSHAVKSELEQSHPRIDDRICVIPNGVDPPAQGSPRMSRESLQAAFGIPPEAPALVHVGSLTPQKGHSVLLNAMQRLHAKRIPAHLVLFGDGALWGWIDGRSRKLGLDKHVHLAGVTDDTMQWLHAFDVFVFPSLWEGFGLALAEAMQVGLPVIASNVDGIPELVGSDGRAGILVPPGDPHQLAARIQEVLGSPERRRELGTNAIQRIEAFGAGRMARAYEDLYATTLARH